MALVITGTAVTFDTDGVHDAAFFAALDQAPILDGLLNGLRTYYLGT